MALRKDYYKNLYKDLDTDELISKYREMKNKYNFQTKDEEIDYKIKKFLEPDDADIYVLEEILKERNIQDYIIKVNNFDITLNDIINFIAKKNDDINLKNILIDFFEKLDLLEEIKIKFLLELVQDNRLFNEFINEVSENSNKNEIYVKYKKIANDYCLKHLIYC